MLTRPDSPKSGKIVTRPDSTRTDPTRGSIRPVDNSDAEDVLRNTADSSNSSLHSHITSLHSLHHITDNFNSFFCFFPDKSFSLHLPTGAYNISLSGTSTSESFLAIKSTVPRTVKVFKTASLPQNINSIGTIFTVLPTEQGIFSIHAAGPINNSVSLEVSEYIELRYCVYE